MTDKQPQFELFHEDIYDALRTCVQAMGGAKKVGADLWPELTPDKAGNRLNDALNQGKRDVINPQQVVLILRMARQAGCHVAMHYIADVCDYERPRPLEPQDELAELQKQFMQSVRLQHELVERIERMQTLREVASNG